MKTRNAARASFSLKKTRFSSSFACFLFFYLVGHIWWVEFGFRILFFHKQNRLCSWKVTYPSERDPYSVAKLCKPTRNSRSLTEIHSLLRCPLCGWRTMVALYCRNLKKLKRSPLRRLICLVLPPATLVTLYVTAIWVSETLYSDYSTSNCSIIDADNGRLNVIILGKTRAHRRLPLEKILHPYNCWMKYIPSQKINFSEFNPKSWFGKYDTKKIAVLRTFPN